MVASSGVLDGQPGSSLFTRGFMARGNLLNIFYGLVMQCILLCGISLVLICGSIDLSVSGQAALGSMIFAILLRDFPQMMWGVALIIALMFGAFLGLINAFLVGKLNLPSFIATIGMATIYRGLCNVITQGENIQIARPALRAIVETRIIDRFPVLFLFAVLLIIAYSFLLSRTTFGRSIFMVGGNRQAARLSGINAGRVRMILFVNSGMLAVLGGAMWSSSVRLASPTAIVLIEPGINVLSAAILGGISFGGGNGTLAGPLVALLLLSVFDNMLRVIGIPTYWNVFAQGLLLIVALIIDNISEVRRRRALIAAQK
jgi:ribose transport system permease protein